MINTEAASQLGLPGGPLNSEDRAAILRQLGYLRYEPLWVVTRTPAGEPQVVLSFFALPPESLSVSTNIFWITDPATRLLVDRLESVQTARTLKDEVLADSSRREQFIEDQRAYDWLARRAFALILGSAPPRNEPFGVGGVRALDQVKCLHAHLAFHLATGRSWVGAQVAARLGSPTRQP